MNERIQALADEAEDYADGIVDAGGEFHPAYTQKFAQLIVRDCVKIIEGYCETSPEIMGLPLEILEHFDMELDDE